MASCRHGLCPLSLQAVCVRDRTGTRDALPLCQAPVEAAAIAAQKVGCMTLQNRSNVTDLGELIGSHPLRLGGLPFYRWHKETGREPFFTPHEITRCRLPPVLTVDNHFEIALPESHAV